MVGSRPPAVQLPSGALGTGRKQALRAESIVLVESSLHKVGDCAQDRAEYEESPRPYVVAQRGPARLPLPLLDGRDSLVQTATRFRKIVIESGEGRLVVPLRVVEELDLLKYDRRRQDRAERARNTIRLLDGWVGSAGEPERGSSCDTAGMAIA